MDDWLRDPLGLDLQGHELGAAHMGLRALVVYVLALAIVRMAKKRFLGEPTAFDVIFGIMLGAIASRGITGNAPLFPALAAAFVLMLAHWVFSAAALRWHIFGLLVKGAPTTIVRNGEVDRAALAREHMSERDLDEELRAHGLSDPAAVWQARLERNGRVSVVKRDAPS